MKHFIDPKVDCVFKAILGKQENEALLIDFLNTALNLKVLITQAVISNPYNEKTRLNAKLSVVDVKVKDQQGRIYQIEIQLTSPKHLVSRMIYTACQLHTGQGVEGESYGKVKPSIAIWLLTNDIPILDESGDVYQLEDGDTHFEFQFADVKNKVLLGNDIEIHTFCLNRWVKPKTIKGFDNWLYFFTHAHSWKALPRELSSSILVEAMKVLEQFSEQEESYHAYISREQARMKERSMEIELEEAQAELNQSKAELDQTNAELSKINAENKALLQRIAELEAKSK